MRDPALGEELRDGLGGRHRRRAHEDRLPSLLALGDVVDDGVELPGLRLEDQVVAVVAHHRSVRRDGDDLHLVDLRELVGLGRGRAGHARDALVHAEVVLEGDRGECLVLLADLQALLRLDGLVQALGVATPLERAAGELVDDQHLVVADEVLLVADEERARLEGLDQVVDELAVGVEVEVLNPERLLDLRDAGLGRCHRAVLLVDLVVDVRLERRHDAGEAVVGVGRGLRDAGDDERRTRLVDQDRVGLVDDREVVAALDAVLEPHGHVVAQVVEAELRVGPEGHVAGVGRSALVLGEHVLDDPDGDPERVVDGHHPRRVTAGQVVVHRDHVHALAREGVQADGEHRREGLALTGAHLGHGALVEDHPADELHVVVAHLHRPLAGLAHQREDLVQDVVEALATRHALPKFAHRDGEPVVAEGGDLRLERVDLLDALDALLHDPALAEAEDAVEEVGAHCVGWSPGEAVGLLRC